MHTFLLTSPHGMSFLRWRMYAHVRHYQHGTRACVEACNHECGSDLSDQIEDAITFHHDLPLLSYCQAITHILANGEKGTIGAFTVHAVPMYNTGPNPHHPEGKWNGYVIQVKGGLVYLSGDTSFIPEMKTNFGFKQRFDHAFLCMNLPYTMGVPEAVCPLCVLFYL